MKPIELARTPNGRIAHFVRTFLGMEYEQFQTTALCGFTVEKVWHFCKPHWTYEIKNLGNFPITMCGACEEAKALIDAGEKVGG